MSTKHTSVFKDPDVLEPLFTIHDKYVGFFLQKNKTIYNIVLTFT